MMPPGEKMNTAFEWLSRHITREHLKSTSPLLHLCGLGHPQKNSQTLPRSLQKESGSPKHPLLSFSIFPFSSSDSALAAVCCHTRTTSGFSTLGWLLCWRSESLCCVGHNNLTSDIKNYFSHTYSKPSSSTYHFCKKLSACLVLLLLPLVVCFFAEKWNSRSGVVYTQLNQEEPNWFFPLCTSKANSTCTYISVASLISNTSL